jgi:hypothetical protein
MHSSSYRDKEVRLQLCRLFQGILIENPDLRNNLLMSDEEDFHLYVAVNRENFRYWSDANPRQLH